MKIQKLFKRIDIQNIKKVNFAFKHFEGEQNTVKQNVFLQVMLKCYHCSYFCKKKKWVLYGKLIHVHVVKEEVLTCILVSKEEKCCSKTLYSVFFLNILSFY